MRIFFSLLLFCILFSSNTLNAQLFKFGKGSKDENTAEKLVKERYFHFEYGLVNIFKFKDLATSPRTYTGYLKNLSFGIYKQTEEKEFEYKLNFFSGYFEDLIKSSYSNGDHKGTLTAYVTAEISRLSKINKWSNENHRVSVGSVVKSIALSRANTAFGNNAVGLDVVVTVMPKIKYVYTFERAEGASFIKRMVIPKKGEFSTSFAVFFNTMVFRSSSYTYTDSKTTLIGKPLENFDATSFKGYMSTFDMKYVSFFGENNHKLIFGYNWGIFDTGGDEPLISSQDGFTVGLMFNLK